MLNFHQLISSWLFQYADIQSIFTQWNKVYIKLKGAK